MVWDAGKLEDGHDYRLLLCQTGSRRFFRVAEADLVVPLGDWTLSTIAVPNDLLRRGDFEAIAAKCPLTDGRRFFVDAHGLWLTEEECRGLRERESMNDIPWEFGLPPRFSPM